MALMYWPFIHSELRLIEDGVFFGDAVQAETLAQHVAADDGAFRRQGSSPRSARKFTIGVGQKALCLVFCHAGGAMALGELLAVCAL